ncbi:hypothetical protein BMS3Bbin10_02045 [bacterium BMS3Bbin10]|nr:hypothetical protein BMS3Bbin10_02045 [bacterium BMS3Bbin10]
MRTRFAILSGAVVVWAMGSVAAQAFEQKLLDPAPAASIAVPAQSQPNLSFGSEIRESKPKKKGRGLKLPGVGKLSIPKLNFGLDLMYGSPETADTGLGFSADPGATGDDDLTILGTFKRRF